MVEQTAKIDAETILSRLKTAGRFKSMAELGRALEMSDQAIANANRRQSIAFPFFIKAYELVKMRNPDITLEKLIYGDTAEDDVADVEKKPADHVEIKRIGGGVVPFPVSLLRAGVNVSKLRAYLQLDRWLLIDISDNQIADGEFAFGAIERPVVRKCESLLDGTVAVEGIEKPQTVDDLKALTIVGRIIWRWTASGN